MIRCEALAAGYAGLDPFDVPAVLEEVFQTQVITVLRKALLDVVKLPYGRV